MKRFFNFIIEENIFIALCASTNFIFYNLKSNNNFSLFSPLFVFFATYLGYHALRLIAFIRDDLQHAPQTVYLYQNKQIYYILTLGCSSIAALYCFLQIELSDLLFPSIAVFIFLFYESFFSKKWSLRKVPYIKPFIITLVWTLFICGLEDISTISPWWDCFIFILLLSIPFDLKDQKDDQKQKIKTFANSFVMTPKLLAIGLLIFSFVFYSKEELPFFIVAVPLYTLSVLNYKKLNKLGFYFIFDGLILYRFLLYLL